MPTPGGSSLSRVAPFAFIVIFALGPNAVLVNAEMSTTFQQTGNLGLEVAGAPGGNVFTSAGTLTLNDIPATATVLQATLYASQIENPNGQDAEFAGVDLGTAGPRALDPGNQDYYTYAWDVTSLVTPGPNGYAFVVGGNPSGGRVAGVALVVVWHDWSEPTRIVTVNDGMLQLGPEGADFEDTVFENLGDGTTDIWLFTVLDDAISSGETITYNGAVIGGPIDQNLGPLASLLKLSATSLGGTNALRVTTTFDTMGWMVAATAVEVPAVPVSQTTWQQVKELYR